MRDPLDLPQAMKMVGILVQKLGGTVEVTRTDYENVEGSVLVTMPGQGLDDTLVVLRVLPKDHPLNPRLM